MTGISSYEGYAEFQLTAEQKIVEVEIHFRFAKRTYRFISTRSVFEKLC